MKRCLFLFLLLFALSPLHFNIHGAETADSLVLCVFGDSYVKNHRCPISETWHFKAAEKLGMKYENRGRNGSALSFDRTAEGFGPAMTERAKTELPDKVDCLLIIAGHNDACAIADNAGLDKFYDSLVMLINYLHSRYPDSKIAWVLPWHVDRGYFTQIIDTINKTCAEMEVPVFNAQMAGGIDVNNIDFRIKYFQGHSGKDTAHLTDAGHNLIVNAGVDFIRNLMK